MRLSGSGDSINRCLRKFDSLGKLIGFHLCLRWISVKEERIMKSNSKGRGAYSVVAAGALVLGLAACDQIQSVWKREEKANPAVGSVTPPQPADGTIPGASAANLPKSIEAPNPPIDQHNRP